MSGLSGLDKLDQAEINEMLGRDLSSTYTYDELAKLRETEYMDRMMDIGIKISLLGFGIMVIGLIIMFMVKYNTQNGILILPLVLGSIIFVIGAVIVGVGRINYRYYK